MNDEAKRLLRTSFGDADKKFAMHPSDERQAERLLSACMDEGTTMSELESEATAWLNDQGCSQDHIVEQLAEIRKKFSAWLSD